MSKIDTNWTTEYIRECYKKIGYVPCRNTYMKRCDKKCCPQSAVLIASNLATEDSVRLCYDANDNFGWDFSIGFEKGFDGMKLTPTQQVTTECVRGYELGKKIATELGI